jgi:N5-(cytidine 5'-diphosphoramidyl)-L-glutamine hydrolase
MKLLVSQRVVVEARHGERRDALDQNWSGFLDAVGFLCVPLPNRPQKAAAFADAISPAGLLLTGGGDLLSLGGDAPERDATEAVAVDWAVARGLPVYGVCRGFQFLLHRAGATLERVAGHVATRHGLSDGTDVNSFHAFAARRAPEGWLALATADDGTLEAAQAEHGAIAGQMWHPERESPFAGRDLARFKQFFGGHS